MTKKNIFKIVPVVLIFVLVISVIVVITSCTKSVKAPYGELSDDKVYASLDLKSGKYTISERELYTRMRYNSYQLFADELTKIVYADELEEIKNNFSKYEADLKELITESIYSTSDQDEIDEMDADEKATMLQTFYDTVYSSGVTNVDRTSTSPFQTCVYEYFYLQLAQENYAKSELLKDVVEVDNENEIKESDIESSYNTLKKNQGDIKALIVKFNSATDASETLKALKLKFVSSKLYRVPEVTGEDYDDTYNEFTTTDKTALNDTEVLFEYVRMYNYIYQDYRTGGVFKVMDKYNVDNLVSDVFATLSTEDATYIRDELDINDLIQSLYDQSISTSTDASTKIAYTYDYLNESDATIKSYLYDTLSFTDSTASKYSYSATEANDGYFLAYKLEDCLDVSYATLKTISEYKDAIDANSSSDEITALFNDLKSAFSAEVVGKTDEECKTYFLGLATTLDAKQVIADASNKELADSIWNTLFDEKFTDTYITSVTEERYNEASITIYDPILEILYSVNVSDYKIKNKKSPDGNKVAKVVYNDKTTYLTVTDTDTTTGLYSIFEKVTGPNIAYKELAKKLLNEKYGDLITDEEMEEFEASYKTTISYFTDGSYEDYGLPASVGQSTFIKVYFEAESKDEAIFNYYTFPRLCEIYLLDKRDELDPELYKKFEQLVKINVEEYFSITYDTIQIYTDDDEDGVIDDPTTYTAARKAQVETAAAAILNEFYSEFNRPSFVEEDGFASIEVEYDDSSRVVPSGTITPDTPLPLKDRIAYLWAQYKKIGIFVTVTNDTTSTNTDYNADEILNEQLNFYYEYAYDQFKDGTHNPTFVARKLTKTGDVINGDNLDVASASTMITSETGYYAFYIEEAVLATSAKFLPSDNPTDGDTKLYPYDISESNPRPSHTTEDGTIVLDEYTMVDGVTSYPGTSLYNTVDLPNSNQILVYMREYIENAGTIYSLSTDVTTTLSTYFDPVLTDYSSDDFEAIMLFNLVATSGASFTDETNETQLYEAALINSRTFFEYEDSAYVTAWWQYFKIETFK